MRQYYKTWEFFQWSRIFDNKNIIFKFYKFTKNCLRRHRVSQVVIICNKNNVMYVIQFNDLKNKVQFDCLLFDIKQSIQNIKIISQSMMV